MTSRCGCRSLSKSAYMVGEDKKTEPAKPDPEQEAKARKALVDIRETLKKGASAEQILRYQAYAAAIGLLGIHDGILTNNYAGFAVPAQSDGSCPAMATKNKQTGKCYLRYESPSAGVKAMEDILANLGVTKEAPLGMLSYLRDGDLDRLADAILLFKQAPIDLELSKKSWEETKAQIMFATGLILELEKDYYKDKKIDSIEAVWKEGTFTPDYKSIKEKGRTECADRSTPVNGVCPEDKKNGAAAAEGEQEGMSTGTKALIAGGAIAALGAIWYFGSRPKAG